MKWVFVRLLLLSMLVSACGSNVTLEPRGCGGDGMWTVFEKPTFKYDNQFKAFDDEVLKSESGFFIKETIWTPWGFLRNSRVLLKSILEDNNIKCEQVATLSVSMTNGWWDIFMSFIPLMSQKTLILAGTLKQAGDG